MNKPLIRLLSCFIPNRERRKRFRLRMQHRYLEPEVHGVGNELINCPPEVKVVIHGDGNRIEFREPRQSFQGLFMIGTRDSPVNRVQVTIGERTSCVYATFWALEDDSKISIGSDCMISKDVQIWCSDAHAILDDAGRLLNGGPHVIAVGDHCWLGFRTTLLKGTVMEEGVILGMNSLVTGGKPLLAHCAYAGSPARLVREHVHWERDTPKNYAMLVCADEETSNL